MPSRYSQPEFRRYLLSSLGKYRFFLYFIVAVYLAWHLMGYLTTDWHLTTFWLIGSIIQDAPWIFLAVVLYLAYIWQRFQKDVWVSLARENGWSYADTGNPRAETGVMFRTGSDRKITNVVAGQIDQRHFRGFNYNFTTGWGNNRKRHQYTVLEFAFQGTFPHMYLDHLRNDFGVSIGRKLSLPREFSQKFSLFVPAEYEIEALAIFTPDLLIHLLDTTFSYDLELLNGHLLVYTPQTIGGREAFVERLRQVQTLVNRLAPQLDHATFTPMTRLSPQLVQ